MSVLKAEGLYKNYGQKQIVKDVSISLEQGEVVGLLGPNGAGKTTTFYMLVGISKPDQGDIYVDKKKITKWPLHLRARFGLSYLPQESSVFKKLTVRQNLEIILEYSNLSLQEQKQKRDMLLSELGIDQLASQKAVQLSGGERRRLEIARALILEPKFILLDEPFAGIDPLAVDDIQKIINDLKERKIGVLITDHNVRETMYICNQVYLVYEGQIILDGCPEEIASDEKARQVYLGERFRL
ncbi:MAG TPA: LPS export ABC transporter ATP-binding protein [Desulfohalobiaceae bacterium]|nr:LPS export ABC transporter ATP-binding protein [Desulfohalobiaceae bacterium]